MGFRSEKIEEYTMRELSIGQIMDLKDEFPSGGNKMTLAMIGESVLNPDGTPLGRDGARTLPGHLVNALSEAISRLHGWDKKEEDASVGNEPSAS